MPISAYAKRQITTTFDALTSIRHRINLSTLPKQKGMPAIDCQHPHHQKSKETQHLRVIL